METPSESGNPLLERLDRLQEQQESLQKEISELRQILLSRQTPVEPIIPVTAPLPEETISVQVPETAPPSPVQPETARITPEKEKLTIETEEPEESPWKNLEKFIGAHLINKIGIAVTVIGIAIGVKYTIDHNLISPLARILLGYLAGATLLGFALQLKKNYLNFSAVLFSGAMAAFYFITYAAESFYNIIPALPAFAVMVLITVVTVASAIVYRRQVIAHIGLVGAYAIPFLIETGPARANIFFSYTAIINAGILIVSLKRYWKPLLWSSFTISWLLLLRWFFNLYDPQTDLATGLVFASLFYLLFYLISMGYKLINNEKFNIGDILLILANSAIFFAVGFAMISEAANGGDFLGLFTLGNALIHAAFYGVIMIRGYEDRALRFFIGGLAILFLTLAVPVQLDGQWVTLLWAGETALLFWLGRKHQTSVFEWISIPMVFLSAGSWIKDGMMNYPFFGLNHSGAVSPFLNPNFGSALLVIAAFGFMTGMIRQKRYPSSLPAYYQAGQVMDVAIPALFLLLIYLSVLFELKNFWTQLYESSMIRRAAESPVETVVFNEDLLKFTRLTTLMFSMLYISLLALLNNRKIRNLILGYACLIAGLIFLAVSLSFGLGILGDLRMSYIGNQAGNPYSAGILHIAVRYPLFLIAVFSLIMIREFIVGEMINIDFRREFDILLHLAVLTMVANELINWMDLAGAQNSYKLGLSILFGCYSLLMILIGIFRRKKVLRIAAMILFGLTLLKLFFYDLVSLSTISKTVIFISLGVLLLIISFLYNKYATRIFSEHQDD